MNVRFFLLFPLAALAGLFAAFCSLAADTKGDLQLTLRSRVKGDGERWTVSVRKVTWDPKKTALIICDMWDQHWCKSAEKRVGELAGPLNDVVKLARSRGMFIIHA